MGMFFPCLAAAVLNGCAFQIFREPMKVGNGPLMALYMFIFTTFILLWSVRLYPRNLRKIGKLQFIVEFLAAEFLMEDLIIDFWFPLEKYVLDSLPTLAQNIEDWASVGEWSTEVVTDFLKNESVGFAASYVMASFFLIGTLHASRVIDLRTLTQEGPTCFVKEIVRKIKMASRRLLRQFGFGKRKVKINELKNTHRDSNSCRTVSSRSKPKTGNSVSFWKGGEKKDGCKHNHNQFCPLHNPFPQNPSDCSDVDDFEDLGAISDLDCS